MAASGMTDTEANATLDARIEAGSVLDLVTTMGTATAAPTKVTGGSYSAQTPTWGAAASRSKSNSATVTFSGLPAATIVGIDLAHSSGAGSGRSQFASFATSLTVNSGDSVIFSSSSLAFSLTNAT